MNLTNLLAAGAVLLAGPVLADSRFVAPGLKLEGKTDGSGLARASLGVLLAGSVADKADSVLHLSAQAATSNGLASFVLSDARAPSTPSWSAGLTLTRTEFTWPDSILPVLEGVWRRREEVFSRCAQACTQNDRDQAFCDLRERKKAQAVEDWLRALVLLNDLPTRGFMGNDLRSLRERVNAWAPSEEGIHGWRELDGYCPAKRDEARKIRGDLASVPKHASPAEKERLIRNGAKALSGILSRCFQVCVDGVPTPEERNFCAANGLEAMPREPDASDRIDWPADAICKQYAKDYARASRPPEASAFPQRTINVGFSVGEARFAYLQPEAGGGTATPRSSSRTSVSAGAAGIFIVSTGPHAITLEGLLAFDQSYKASGTTVHWCTPSVSVSQNGRVDPGQICQDRGLGAPTESQAVAAAFHVGTMNTSDPGFRVALGVDVSLPLNERSAVRWSGSLSLPIYLVVASKESSLYKGLVRVGPALTHTEGRAGGASETSLVLSLALLGQRSIFSEQFDSL